MVELSIGIVLGYFLKIPYPFNYKALKCYILTKVKIFFWILYPHPGKILNLSLIYLQSTISLTYSNLLNFGTAIKTATKL